MKNKAGGKIDNIVYIVKEEHQSLWGLKDTMNLSIVSFKKEGEEMEGLETVNPLHAMKKTENKIPIET